MVASCEVQSELLSDDTATVNKEIARLIYESSMPLFRKMIHQGRVRFTIIDHKKVTIFRILHLNHYFQLISRFGFNDMLYT